MLRLVVLGLLGTCLPLVLAFPANNAAVTAAPAPVPTKYAACKQHDCPLFRVVQRFASDVELREYSRAFWISAKTQAPRIDRNVTLHLYLRLRRYIRKSNHQLQEQKRKFCSGRANRNVPAVCERQKLKTGVPVTRLFEQTTKGMKAVTMLFYLSSPSPSPPPHDSKVSLQYESLLVYVKVFKNESFYTRLGEGHAHVLANELIGHGVDGTSFYAPSAKYMTAGYDSPFIPPNKRTNEVWLIKKPASTK